MRQCSSSYRMSGLDRRTNVDVQILSAASKAIAEKCFWNACKALSFGLFLMAVGAIMAIIGYYAEQLSSDDIITKTDNGNSSTSIRTTKTTKKSSHIYKLSYAGPIVMGVGGFIVVAACVMTFEARDRAAKFMSNQLKIMGSGVGGGQVSGHRGHGRQTPSAGYLSRGDSGRSSYQNPCDGGRHKMNKSPSAPNLAAAALASANRGPGGAAQSGVGRLPLRHKHAVHVLSSSGGGGGGGAGRALLSPHTLRRQAMSMDTQDYNPLFSPPRSRHSSSGLLTYSNSNGNNFGNFNCSNGNKQGGDGSRESVNDPMRTSSRGSRGSMVLDLHVPNECPVTMRVRDRSRRSDTARRHVLRRQTPVELDDTIIAYAAASAMAADHHRQRAKRCTRSATCDVPHVVKSKRRRQDSSCSDVLAARRRSGSPVCGGVASGGGRGGGWRSSANDVVDAAEWARTSNRGTGGDSAVSSPQRFANDRSPDSTPIRQQSQPTGAAVDGSKMSLSRTCSDIMSIDKSFEESNYSSS